MGDDCVIFLREVRKELRLRKLTTKKFAKMMNVSEPTMKRWFNGKGLLLKDWYEMLKVLNLNPVEVVGNSSVRSVNRYEYTLKQEDALSKVPGLLSFYQQIIEGISVDEIARNYDLKPRSLTYYLNLLDRIELIRWKEGYDFKLINSGEPRWRKDGPLAIKFREKVFNELIYENRKTEKLKLALYRVSLEDFQKIQELISEIYEYGKNAEQISKFKKGRLKTIGLASCISEYKPDFLYSIPNVK